MKSKFYYIVLLFLLFFIFNPWLNFSKTLSSGDWPYLYKENIQEFKIPTQLPFLWLEPYHQITAKIGVEFLHLSWDAAEKMFWFLPFIFLSLLSSYKFVKFFLRRLSVNKFLDLFTALGMFIYLANTYILMIVGGGQMGVAMAYSLAPLVLYFSLRIFSEKEETGKFLFLSSIVLAVQLMFDPRIFILTSIPIFLYFVWSLSVEKIEITRFKKIIFMFLIAIALNMFWIFPNLTYYGDTYAQITKEPQANFLSFASFSNSISLLHPNWPDNVFGKIGFMKPEFILVAIFAYLSSLFIDKKNRSLKMNLLFLLSMGLLGAFLAKGVNPPFGFIYEFFSNLPGASSFRDPTKFYLWISLSYSILVPFAVFSLYNFLLLKAGRLKIVPSLFLIFVMVYFIFLTKPALTGNLNGTFKPSVVPNEYVNFKDFIISQKSSFSTLWIPTVQRFTFSDDSMPAINGADFFYPSSTASMSAFFRNDITKQNMKNAQIKYVVVPYDTQAEIFVKNRKYDQKAYDKIISDLQKIKYLRELGNDGRSEFGKVVVFEVIY